MNINGGGIGLGFIIVAGIVFLIGVLEGFLNPSKCK